MSLRLLVPVALISYVVLLVVFALGFAYDDLQGAARHWPATGFANRDVFLLAVLAGILVAPLVAVAVGVRAFAFALAPAFVLAAIAYLVLSTWYYIAQEHLFDPFLQKHPLPMPEEELAARGDEIRVLAIGGSTTRNYALEPEERYPATLERLLAERYTGETIRVHNAGMGFWTAKHSLINYVTYARRWKPDIAVIMHAVNDLYRSLSPSVVAAGEYDDAYTHYYGPAIHGAKPPTFPEFLYETFLLRLDRRWYPSLRWHPVDLPLAEFRSVVPFERYLRTLIEVLREDGVRVVLLTQASIWKHEMEPEEDAILDIARIHGALREGVWRTEHTSPGSMHDAHRVFNDVVRRVAAEEGVPLAELADTIEKRLENFRDDVHYKPPGAAAVARGAADAIARLDGLRRLGAPEPTPGATAPPDRLGAEGSEGTVSGSPEGPDAQAQGRISALSAQ